ncbi:MAG: hypothetical protein M1826_001713 [Phylliscum demangeonii]|nr:MAG: hypothetical protein M1826_001713 [Phylliscum demangeonii]
MKSRRPQIGLRSRKLIALFRIKPSSPAPRRAMEPLTARSKGGGVHHEEGPSEVQAPQPPPHATPVAGAIAVILSKLLRPLRKRSEPPAADQRQPEGDEGRPTASFLSLPVEICLQIIGHVGYEDLITLRHTSRGLRQLMSAHEGSIVRAHVRGVVPADLLALVDPLQREAHTLCFLAQLAYRQRVCRQLARLMMDFVSREHFHFRTERQRRRFVAEHEHAQRKMVPLLFLLFHHFESFQRRWIWQALPLPAIELDWPAWESENMQQYAYRDLILATEMYTLVSRALERQLRPPSYAGRVERLVRGWTQQRPVEGAIVRLFLIGGLPEVRRILAVADYGARVRALHRWSDALDGWRHVDGRWGRTKRVRGPPPPPLPALAPCVDRYWLPQSCARPMPRPSSGELLHLLPRLPHIWEVWFPAAEWELVTRGVLQGPNSIPAPHQFLMELLRRQSPEDVDHRWYEHCCRHAVGPTGERLPIMTPPEEWP